MEFTCVVCVCAVQNPHVLRECSAESTCVVCECSAELMLYEPLGLCEQFTAKQLIEGGRWTRNKAGGELLQLGGRSVCSPLLAG